MYDRILALFSAVPYAAPSTQGSGGEATMDHSAHLTNTALQKERGEAGVRLLDELVGCHILSAPQQTPRRQRPPHAMGVMLDPETRRPSQRPATDYSVFSLTDVDDLKKQICDLLAETFKAAVEMSVHFQVYSTPI